MEITTNIMVLLSSIWDMALNLYNDMISWTFELGGNTYGIFTVFTSAFIFVLIGVLILNWVVPN